MIGDPPRDDRCEHREALAADPAEPAAPERAEQRPGGERAVERARRLRAAAVDLLGDRGEQRARHREDHGDEVDDEGQQQHRPGGEEAQPLDDARQPGRAAAALGRHRRQRAHRPDRRGEAHRVEPVRGAEPERADEQAGEQRADGDADVELDLAQRVRRRQQVRRQQPRHEGLAGRAVEREQARLAGDDDVQQPGLLEPGDGLGEQHGRAARPARRSCTGRAGGGRPRPRPPRRRARTARAAAGRPARPGRRRTRSRSARTPGSGRPPSSPACRSPTPSRR